MAALEVTADRDIVYSSFVLASTGLVPVGAPSYEQWEAVGFFIKQTTNACALWLGDWINYGKPRFGEKYYLAIVKTGLDYGTLRNAAYTARRINLSDRSDKLGYKHHELVASLPASLQRNLLREAERRDYSARELKIRVQDIKRMDVVRPLLPKGIYSVLYVDPPWDIEAMVFNKWRDPLPYPTLTLDQLKSLQLPRMSSDCVLFLWSTLSTLQQALELLTHWGFTYHITITWDKGSGFCMSGFNRRSELLLVGYTGILGQVIQQEREFIPTVFYEAKTTHSTKPQAMYRFIEQRTIGNRIELFARKKRPGWDAWGNELEEGKLSVTG
jgi:N6-adenosine-specific RNA methylase IME4